MTLQIRRFEPRAATTAEWRAYHGFRRIRHDETDPEDPILGDGTVERRMKMEDPEWEEVRYTATREEDPTRLAGWLELGMTREGALSHETNGHMMWVDIQVHPDERRRGVATRLLARALEVAKERNRSTLIGGTHEGTGKAFLKAIGAETGLAWRESRLYLDEMDWEKMERWVREGQRRSPGTDLIFFNDLPEPSMIEAYCELLQEVSNQEPRGNLDLGDDLLTPSILKERVDQFAKIGGTMLRAVTVEEDGALSGLTTLGYLPDERTHVHQWMTGVREAYRGRGLGKWLKAAQLLRIRDELPQVRVVRTGNATINAAMLSINVRLGFRPYREGVEGQLSVASLGKALAERPPS